MCVLNIRLYSCAVPEEGRSLSITVHFLEKIKRPDMIYLYIFLLFLWMLFQSLQCYSFHARIRDYYFIVGRKLREVQEVQYFTACSSVFQHYRKIGVAPLFQYRESCLF